jgi:hypothetical protein
MHVARANALRAFTQSRGVRQQSSLPQKELRSPSAW